MADISKIKLANGTTVTLKDAAGRADFATLLGTNTLAALGNAAWHAMATSISDVDGKIADAATVKAYVDAQIQSIPEFDVVVVPDGEDLPTASKDTFHKIYLKKEGISGTYTEYITVKIGNNYVWERIGTLDVDLAAYVKKTTTIAGISLENNISVADLQAALGLGELAYANSASGSTTLGTIDSITMNDLTVAGNATVTSSDAEAVLTKAAFTPEGSITGSAISGGSINVTLRDQTAKTEAELSTSTYVPTGTVAAVDGGSFSALKSATFQADSANGVQIEGSVSAPAINLTSSEKEFATGLTGGKVASFIEGAFTPASISEGFFSAGTLPTKAADIFDGGSFEKGSAVSAATEGITASVGTGADAETLIFTAAATDEVMDYGATYTAATYTEGTFTQGTLPSIDTNKFDGGSKAGDTFEANVLQSVSTAKVNHVTAAALASAPVFTGSKYAVATTDDTALKSVAFTATNSADIVSKVEYVKQDVDVKTFTPVAATLSFSGKEIAELIPSKVTYKKADATAAFSETVTPAVKTYNRTDKTVEITVTPNAE